jgi:uncharacterized protein YndB with AHSA1/START domain
MANKAESKTEEIVIARVFDSAPEHLWKAWTDPEMIKRWWGPEYFSAPSIRLDLRVGGKYVWAMRGPAGSKWDMDMFTAGVYKEIVPNSKLVLTSYMSDQDGNMLDAAQFFPDPASPNEMTFSVFFEEIEKGKTRLSIVYARPETEAQFQAMLKSGMQEGWTSSFNKMAEALR